MALQLSQASSLNAGSDLWIVPDGFHSSWYGKLDWYLNFRLAKYELKPHVRMSPYFEGIVEYCELPVFTPPESKSTMVASAENLPCKWVVSVNYNPADLKSWCQEILGIWKNLGVPSLRVFLPSQLEIHIFESTWNQVGGIADYSVVSDSQISLS